MIESYENIFPRIIVDDWIISTQKHCSVNFIASHVKKSYFGKKIKSFCTEDRFFPHRWARNAQLLQYVEYCLWWETNNLGLGTTKTVLIEFLFIPANQINL